MAFLCKYFIYNGEISSDLGLAVCLFDNSPMSEAPTQLGMTPIYSDTISSAYRIDYGAKYNSVLTPTCIIVHEDGTAFTFSEKRNILKWLTGKKDLGWLQIKRIDDEEDFVPDEGQTLADDPNLVNVLCRVTDVTEYKIGNETVGFQIVWTSNSPFAYSPIVYVDWVIEPTHYQYTTISQLHDLTVDTDEQFDYIYPSVEFINTSTVPCELRLISHSEDDRTTSIKNISVDKVAFIDNLNQIATVGTEANPTESIAGDNFNLTWFRLLPGSNSVRFRIARPSTWEESDLVGGYLEIKYRTPVKVGEL